VKRGNGRAAEWLTRALRFLFSTVHDATIVPERTFEQIQLAVFAGYTDLPVDDSFFTRWPSVPTARSICALHG
jgi:hypothetical protein